jgi:Sec-independent protein translocase protein TatA
MALSDPLQLFSVILIGAGIFLFDPQKIPETARAMGRVRKEFEAAQRNLKQVTRGLQVSETGAGQAASQSLVARLIGGVPPASLPSSDAPAQPQGRTADEILVDTAHELELSTDGKTREEISHEILTKVRSANQQSHDTLPRSVN